MSAGLYLHIPFCASKCAYCDFCSRPSGDDVKRAYVRALINEIEYMSSKFEGKIDTVYVGGGTPSCLPRGELARLAGAVFSCFDCEVSEFTAEANPESFDKSKADEYEGSGVTRVSLGVQSTDNGILRFLGRAHDFEAAKRAAHIAARFDLSLDQMLGLPGQTEGQLEEFVAFADSVGAAHLSSYILKVEDGTELAKRVKDGLVLPDDDRCADLYDVFVAAAAKRGYLRYETSNFAREGKRCRHNLKYWRQDRIEALLRRVRRRRLYPPRGKGRVRLRARGAADPRERRGRVCDDRAPPRRRHRRRRSRAQDGRRLRRALRREVEKVERMSRYLPRPRRDQTRVRAGRERDHRGIDMTMRIAQ